MSTDPELGRRLESLLARAAGPADAGFHPLTAVIYLPDPEAAPTDLSARLARLEPRLTRSSINQRFFDPEVRRRALAGAPARVRQWYGSRACLCDAAESLLSQDVAHDRVRLGLSHCQGFSIAIAWDAGPGPAELRAGVDIERLSRRISDGARAKFTVSSELTLGLSALEIWCIKEACFKASPPSWSGTVPDYRVEGSTPRVTCSLAPGSAANKPFLYDLARTDGHVIGFAALVLS